MFILHPNWITNSEHQLTFPHKRKSKTAIMSIAEKYMRNEKSQDSADATLLLLNLMSVDSDRFKLSKEEKEKVEKAIDSVKYQNKALVQIYRERLGKKWEEYPTPEWDMLKVRGDYERAKILVADAAKNTAAEQKEEITPEQRYLASRLFEDIVVTQDGAKYRIDHRTGHPDKSRPIQYDAVIEWVAFSKEVHSNPYTKHVDLHRTLGNLIDECKRVGCNRTQLVKVLKLMVENHFPTHYNALSYATDNSTIWELILGMLDYSDHLTKVKSWMKSIKRKVGEGVNKPVQEYQSLIREILNIQSPYATDDENREMAVKESAKAIKHFVTKACWSEVQAYKERHFQKHRQHLTLEELFNFVTFCENEPGSYKPTSVLSLENQEVRIDLFISETQQTWSWQFGADYSDTGDREDNEAEIHSNETRPSAQYENYQFSTPPQSDRDGPTTRSMPPTAADLKAREQPRHSWGNRPGAPSTRRRPEKSKPGSDKSKAATRSKSSASSNRSSSGTSRGTSRERSSSGNRSSAERSGSKKSGRPTSKKSSEGSRNKSRSGKPSSRSGADGPERSRRKPTNRTASPGRCWLCWTRHPEGRCDYGRIKPVKDMCECRKGYHPRSVCLNRAGSPGRSPSKSKFGGDNFLPKPGSGN